MKNDINKENLKRIANILNIVREDKNTYEGYSFADCIKNGFVVVNKDGIVYEISKATFDLLKEDFYDNNKTLFANFSIPDNMTDNDYYAHQIMHYFSTYGLENYGLEPVPYIPGKELWGEVATDNCKIKVYRMLSNYEFGISLRDYIMSIKNPNNSYKDLYIDILRYVNELYGINDNDIRGYEIKVLYYNICNVYPKNPIDFLRYVIYLKTGSTLIIKNKTTIHMIKYEHYCSIVGGTEDIILAFKNYDIKKLASIFYRFKPLFLAFKKAHRELIPIINRTRKLAPKYQRPLSGLCVQNLIDMYISDLFSLDEIKKIIKTIDTRDIFKIINSISSKNNDINIYSIRNGRAYVKDNNKKYSFNKCFTLYNTLIDELKYRYSVKFTGKIIIIPKYISYALPISEKAMVGKYPNGTSINVGYTDPLSIGVSWHNISKEEAKHRRGYYNDNGRVDIDLHLVSATQHFGWNAYRKSSDAIYSGDMTDATDGAAEAFYITKTDEDYIIDTRLYTGNGPVDMNLFINKRAVEKPDRKAPKGYIYDPSEDIVPSIKLPINNEGLNIGMYHNGKIYLYNKSISAGQIPIGEYYEKFIRGLGEKFDNQIKLSDILTILGANIIDNVDKQDQTKINEVNVENHLKDDANEDVIDLSPETIDETTLYNLFN